MIEDSLGGLLENAGDATQVGPLPIAKIRAGAARRRRRRTIAATIGAITTVAAVALAAAVVAPSGSGTNSPQPPASSAMTEPVPHGMRLVGLNGAAIAVPQDWGTNGLSCGSPVGDTVVIDLGRMPRCGWTLQPRTEIAEVRRGEPSSSISGSGSGLSGVESIDIGGVVAERHPTGCQDLRGRKPPIGNPASFADQICGGAVYVPSLDVSFRVTSTTDADSVDRLLEGVRITPGQVGVPGINETGLEAFERTTETYAARLQAEGLGHSIKPQRDQYYPAGVVLGVEPAVGTLVRAGDKVTVLVSTGPGNMGLGVDPAQAVEQVHDGIGHGVVKSIDIGDQGDDGRPFDVEVDPAAFDAEARASIEANWLASLIGGAVGNLIRTDERTIGDVIRGRNIVAVNADGDSVSERFGGSGVKPAGLELSSPPDAELEARVHAVASQFGLTVKALDILHPLESAIQVTYTVPDTVTDLTMDELFAGLAGTPGSIEGAFITLVSTTGEPLIRAATAQRTSTGSLWFAPGQDTRFRAGHSGVAVNPFEGNSGVMARPSSRPSP